MAVLVLDKSKKPLMPCSERRARLLLERGRAVVHRRFPFTIRLRDRQAQDSAFQPVRLKLDPGSKATGVALVRDTAPESRSESVLLLAEIQHRGQQIKANLDARRAMRRARRQRKTRYRAARFDNRTKPQGWLAPSLQHRVDTTMPWVRRLARRQAPMLAVLPCEPQEVSTSKHRLASFRASATSTAVSCPVRTVTVTQSNPR